MLLYLTSRALFCLGLEAREQMPGLAAGLGNAADGLVDAAEARLRKLSLVSAVGGGSQRRSLGEARRRRGSSAVGGDGRRRSSLSAALGFRRGSLDAAERGCVERQDSHASLSRFYSDNPGGIDCVQRITRTESSKLSISSASGSGVSNDSTSPTPCCISSSKQPSLMESNRSSQLLKSHRTGTASSDDDSSLLLDPSLKAAPSLQRKLSASCGSFKRSTSAMSADAMRRYGSLNRVSEQEKDDYLDESERL